MIVSNGAFTRHELLDIFKHYLYCRRPSTLLVLCHSCADRLKMWRCAPVSRRKLLRKQIHSGKQRQPGSGCVQPHRFIGIVLFEDFLCLLLSSISEEHDDLVAVGPWNIHLGVREIFEVRAKKVIHDRKLNMQLLQKKLNKLATPAKTKICNVL